MQPGFSKRNVLLLAFFGLLGVTVPAFAAAPTAWLEVMGQQWEIDEFVQDGDLWNASFSLSDMGWAAAGQLHVQSDPYISYGIAFTNFTGQDIGFALYVSNPIDFMFDDRTFVYSSYSGSGTDVEGDGFHIIANVADSEGDNDGVDELQMTWLDGFYGETMTVDVGQTFSDNNEEGYPPGHSDDLGAFSSGPRLGPAGFHSTQDLLLSFDLAGGGDIATLNGYSTIYAQPIPEPTSLVLIGLGLAGAVVVRARRKA